MVKMMTAYTTELDETNDAISEILSQIDKSALLKNSVGIITCHFDFIDSGLLEALHTELAFDIIGMTTMASANVNGSGMFGLSLSVLTSDDVFFAAGMSETLEVDNYRELLTETFNETVAKLPCPPKFMITFSPYHRELRGNTLPKALNEISDGLPIWGSFATNTDISYDDCCTILNDATEAASLAMLLIGGAVEPEFVNVSIPAQNINNNRAVITESDGDILKKVNDLPVLEYLGSIGVTVMKDASTTVPFMVYYEGSAKPVALGVFAINDDNTLLCGGEMPVGAQISIGEINHDSIIKSLEDSLRLIQEIGKSHNAVLMLPCVTRYVMLSPKKEIELELITETMKKSPELPYSLGYSGGEICPVRDDSGKYINRFHNYTFSACII
ncbi:MAG: FIST C-terminal domain-containing protein [Oscillospiraceae bacterium]|nr:FIST C-terminal domain-containing protein [Oscillospiraceae bacterium]